VQPPPLGLSALSTAAARATQSGIPRQVVFLPTCVNRMMGAMRGDAAYSGSTAEVFTRLAHKAGYEVIIPQARDGGGARAAACLPCLCADAAGPCHRQHLRLLPRACAAPALQGIDRLCCGMMFDTRGAVRAAGTKVAEVSTELLLASHMGKLPIGVCGVGADVLMSLCVKAPRPASVILRHGAAVHAPAAAPQWWTTRPAWRT
jgi:hypothetical protein